MCVCVCVCVYQWINSEIEGFEAELKTLFLQIYQFRSNKLSLRIIGLVLLDFMACQPLQLIASKSIFMHISSSISNNSF